MLTYRVYLWLCEQSQEAEVVLDVQALDATHALLVAMEHQSLSYVDCAWVISPDDDTVDARAEGVFLMTFEEAQQFLNWSQSREVLHVE
jgi:hypothetical protein